MNRQFHKIKSPDTNVQEVQRGIQRTLKKLSETIRRTDIKTNTRQNYQTRKCNNHNSTQRTQNEFDYDKTKIFVTKTKRK